MSFRQNTISGPETYQIRPKVLIWSCPDLSRRTHMGPIWAHMGPYGPQPGLGPLTGEVVQLLVHHIGLHLGLHIGLHLGILGIHCFFDIFLDFGGIFRFFCKILRFLVKII